MEIKYRWERNECYMLVDAGEINADHYQLRMLENNRIDGLLKVQLQQINQQAEFCYTISGRQSMVQKYENICINVDEIKKLMAALNKTAGRLEEFLLNIDSLRLEPEWIYWKEDGDGQPEFCYYPEEVPEKSFREHVRTLLRYLLNKISHKDSDAVDVAYNLYQISMKETFRMQELMQFLFYGTEKSDMSGGEEGLYSTLQEDMEQRGDNGYDAYKMTDYERIDKGSRKGQRQRKKQNHDQEGKQGQKQRKVRGQRRLVDYGLAFSVAALALAAVLRLGVLWYGRREVISEKETIIHIGLVCVIVVVSGIAIYKLMAKAEVPAVVWESPEETADWEQAQGFNRREGAFFEERPTSEQRSGRKHMLEHEAILEQSVISNQGIISDQRIISDQKFIPEQGLKLTENDFPEATCILTGSFHPPVMGWWLRYQGAEKNIKDFFLNSREGQIMVGKRLKAPDIALNWPTVSRHHAVFQIESGICTVRDCGSTNGTYLNGERLGREETRVLLSGSELKFADIVFRAEQTARDENATTVLTGL